MYIFLKRLLEGQRSSEALLRYDIGNTFTRATQLKNLQDVVGYNECVVSRTSQARKYTW